MSSLACERLFGHGGQAGGVLLVLLVGLDERGLLGLDDSVASLDALRPTQGHESMSVVGLSLSSTSAARSVVEEFTYGLAGALGPVLDFLSCACGILLCSPLYRLPCFRRDRVVWGRGCRGLKQSAG